MPKRRVGDDALDRNLTIRVSDEMRAHIERLAAAKDWTVGLIVREAIKAGLPVVEKMRNGGSDD